jgi:hypothetical protein
MHQTSGLKYYCAEAMDGAKELCTIKQASQDLDEIRAWLRRLPDEPDYYGEGLAPISKQVLRPNEEHPT